MNDCTTIRDLFGAVLENEASDAERDDVRSHVEECAECSELFDAMSMVVGAGEFMSEIEPPTHIAEEISANPCRRWLGLLYQAVDREISPANLDRLLTHLETCPSCRQVWHDLTLIHQVGDAMAPPRHLLDRCLRVREAVARITVLPRRTATAAAYVLALLASLAIGNPAIIAQDLQAVASEKVTRAASEVSEVAADGRGEARVALWRAMRWGESKIDAVRGWIDRLTDNDDDAGESTAEPDSKIQGEDS
jgi:predicted anti-sigma-YlaC factor YlaD